MPVLPRDFRRATGNRETDDETAPWPRDGRGGHNRSVDSAGPVGIVGFGFEGVDQRVGLLPLQAFR